jgi:hypothetical protein
VVVGRRVDVDLRVARLGHRAMLPVRQLPVN